MKIIINKGIKLLIISLIVRTILSSILSTLYTLEIFTFIYGLVFLGVEKFFYNLVPNLIFVLLLCLSAQYLKFNGNIKLILYILFIIIFSSILGHYYMKDLQILFDTKASINDIIEDNYFTGYRYVTMLICYTTYVIIFYYKIEIPYQKSLK